MCYIKCRLSDVQLISIHEGEETNDFCALIGDKSHYHSMLEGEVVSKSVLFFCYQRKHIKFAFETLLYNYVSSRYGRML